MEFFCTEENRLANTYFRCDPMSLCQDGACVAVEAQEPVCSDSDGGADPTRRGAVTGTHRSGAPFDWRDSCSADGEVIEWTCTEADTPDAVYLECGEGETCRGGVCAEQRCEDSDPADDPSLAGRVTNLGGDIFPDRCEGDWLHQFDCADDGAAVPIEDFFCKYGCANGACL